MGKEIERKFLLAEGASIPIPAKFAKFKIKQAYIHAEKGKQVRVRITTGKAVLGIKYTGDLVRDEFEYEIPMKDAKVMYDKSSWKVEKNRLTFQRGKEHYDVDTFPNGMKFVEVEFKSLKDMEAWVKPSWIGEEITGVSKYSNINLAKKNLMF